MAQRFYRRFLMYLGNGKALEFYLVAVKLTLALDILSPRRSGHISIVIEDLIWWVPEFLLATPLFAAGTIQLVGVVMNYRGMESSWIPRFTGSVLSCFIWAWIVLKSLAIGEIHTGLFPFAGMSFFASGFVALRAWNQVPIPGCRNLTL